MGSPSSIPKVLNREFEPSQLTTLASKGKSSDNDCQVNIASWNIRSGRGGGLKAAAQGLRQMGVRIAVL